MGNCRNGSPAMAWLGSAGERVRGQASKQSLPALLPDEQCPWLDELVFPSNFPAKSRFSGYCSLGITFNEARRADLCESPVLLIARKSFSIF